MAWPPVGYLIEDGADVAYRSWAEVANAVVAFEPVTMVVDPTDIGIAKQWLDDQVTIVTAPLDDAWMRDIGPTFVFTEGGSIAGIDWIFNGWGAQDWSSWEKDQEIASFVCTQAGSEVIPSTLINEGGGIHVNGSGAILLTKTVQMGVGRNSSWAQDQVEAELTRTLGVDQFIWFDRGLTRDYDAYGTRGHVDIMATFVNESTILFHDQQDPRHPDFEVSKEIQQTIEASGFQAVGVPAPTVLTDENGFVDFSYINHYVVNGAVIMCSFDDHNDALAKRILEDAYPERQVVMVDAREIFARGGGIHCITQQQPAKGNT
jgi:agmatine deiminase